MALSKKDYPLKIKTNLYSNKSYSTFYYDFTLNGKRYRGLIDLSSKTSLNKREKIICAEAKLIEIRNRKKDNIFDDSISLDTYIKKHFELCVQGRWVDEKKAFYESHIKESLGKKEMREIKPLHVKEVFKKIADKGLSQRTVKRVLEVLNPAFKEAYSNRVIEYNPLTSLSVKRPSSKKIVSKASEELLKINNAIEEVFGEDAYYQALFLFALQGRRKNEILSLKWKDVNFDKNMYVLRNTKNNEEQKIFLPKRIKELLLVFKDDSWEYVFTSPITKGKLTCTRNAVQKIKDKLDNQKFGLHYLRNVIVSAMAEQGLESIYLSGALGHNDPNTIKQYLTMNYLKSSEMASDVIDKIIKK